MELKKLQKIVISALEDIKGQDICVYDTTHLTSLFDNVIIVSGTSNRQTKALASSVHDKVKENGGHVNGMEGGGTGEWVLVDLGDIVVHIMQPTIRAYYRLEEIWGGKEVKLGAAVRTKRVVGDAAIPKKAPVKRVTKSATTKSPAVPKTAAPKVAATKKVATTKKATPIKKVVTPKTTLTKKVVAPKTTPTKKAVAPKAALKKTVTKRAPKE